MYITRLIMVSGLPLVWDRCRGSVGLFVDEAFASA